jgi:hypothetical protein
MEISLLLLFYVYRKLDLVIQKLIMKGRILILSCDWIINFSQDSVILNELKNVLLI